jgi:uncharacterized RDD family membrane protein YckC
MYQNENEPSLLEIELELDQEPATKGQRFANYLIDAVFFYIVVLVFVAIAALINPRQAAIFAEGAESNVLINYVLGPLLYAVFYAIIEGISGGRTLGKLITKTKVIKEDGTLINWKDALLRSLSRIVPFEVFTALGDSPWHDSWTKTKVIKVIK